MQSIPPPSGFRQAGISSQQPMTIIPFLILKKEGLPKILKQASFTFVNSINYGMRGLETVSYLI